MSLVYIKPYTLGENCPELNAIKKRNDLFCFLHIVYMKIHTTFVVLVRQTIYSNSIIQDVTRTKLFTHNNITMKNFLKYLGITIISSTCLVVCAYIFSVGLDKNLYAFYFVGTLGSIASIGSWFVVMLDIKNGQI